MLVSLFNRSPGPQASLAQALACALTALVLGWAPIAGSEVARAEEEAATASPEVSASKAERSPVALRQLRAWLDEKGQNQVSAMPAEARLAYRRGLIAWKAGEDAEAVGLMRGAAELDPSFAAPHLVLTQWFLTREPSQALLSGAALVHRLKNDFVLQLELAGNATFLLFTALFWALLAGALILVGLHQHELRHVWSERLGIALSSGSARVWPWTFLALPWGLGLGLGVPALVLLAMLWPVLKARERLVFLALAVIVAAAPLAPTVMGRLALPLREEGAPFHGILAVEHAAEPAATQAQFEALANLQPESPFVHFGLAWSARRAGDLPAAERAYRRALQIWPSNDRALNNLGNLLAMQGRFDEALRQYERATEVQPGNAAAHFNASQVHTRLFDYPAASDAVARASALDFEMVRTYQSRSGEDLPLVDQWVAPATFWTALAQAPITAVPVALPPAWNGTIETSGWPFVGLALVLTLAGLGVGLWWQRRMPLRACSNCARPVCRRCAHRQREQALCPGCATIAARAESAEFGRVLLAQQRRRTERTGAILRTVVSTTVPGWGMIATRRTLAALVLLGGTSLLVMPLLEVRGPFALGSGLDAGFGRSGWWSAGCWLLVYFVSIAGFLGRSPEAEPVTARPQTATRPGVRLAEPSSRAA